MARPRFPPGFKDYPRIYSETRNSNIFDIEFFDVDEKKSKLVVRINNVVIFDRNYDKICESGRNNYFLEVAKVHLGIYDSLIKEKKNEGDH